MNENQKRYALKRIEQIKRDRINSTSKERNKQLESLPEQSAWEDMIRSGQAILKERVWESQNLKSAFEYPIDRQNERRRKEIFAKEKKQVDKIEKEARRLCDQIVLGDSDEALKMIEKFEGEE